MRRHSSPYASSYSFGPGPLSSAMKVLIGANVAFFLLQTLVPDLQLALALVPSAVVVDFQIWRLVGYMFLH